MDLLQLTKELTRTIAQLGSNFKAKIVSTQIDQALKFFQMYITQPSSNRCYHVKEFSDRYIFLS